MAALSSSSPPPQAANASTPAATMTSCRRVVMSGIIAFPGTPQRWNTALIGARPAARARDDAQYGSRHASSGGVMCRARRSGCRSSSPSVAGHVAAATVPAGFADSGGGLVRTSDRGRVACPTAGSWCSSRTAGFGSADRPAGFTTAIDIAVCGGTQRRARPARVHRTTRRSSATASCTCTTPTRRPASRAAAPTGSAGSR